MIQQEINLYEEPKPTPITTATQWKGGVTVPWTQSSIDVAIRRAIANGFGIGAQFHYHTSANTIEVVRFVTDPKETKTFAGGPAILECKYLNGTLGLTYYSLPEVLRKDTFILSKKSPIDIKEETNEQEDCN